MRAICIAVLLAPLGCGDGGSVGNSGDLVGGPCDDDSDCASASYCQHGGAFPDGTCTQKCAVQAHCPPGTACVEKEGGICLLLCRFQEDCRLEYRCKSTKRIEDDGNDMVCIE